MNENEHEIVSDTSYVEMRKTESAISQYENEGANSSPNEVILRDFCILIYIWFWCEIYRSLDMLLISLEKLIWMYIFIIKDVKIY